MCSVFYVIFGVRRTLKDMTSFRGSLSSGTSFDSIKNYIWTCSKFIPVREIHTIRHSFIIVFNTTLAKSGHILIFRNRV